MEASGILFEAPKDLFSANFKVPPDSSSLTWLHDEFMGAYCRRFNELGLMVHGAFVFSIRCFVHRRHGFSALSLRSDGFIKFFAGN